MKRSILAVTFAIFVVFSLSLSAAYGQQRSAPRSQGPAANMSRLLMRLLDLNNDGKISGGEFMKFFTDADQDKNGSIEQKEVTDLVSKRRQGGTRPDRQEAGGPDLEQKAPDFTLRRLDGDGTVKLSDFIGKKPVVLVFGSYT